MTTVIDTVSKARHPEKAHRPDNDIQRKPDWIRVKAPVSQGICRHPRDRARQQAAHGVRGGGLSEHRGVLDQAPRHHDDHGRHLHPGLRLLQREDRSARRRWMPKNRPMSPARCKTLGLTHVVITSVDRDDLADGGAQHFADVIHAMHARKPRHLGGSADAGLPAQGRRHRDGDGGPARSLQSQSGNRAAALSDHPARRALFRVAAAAGTGQGTDARPASPSPG